MERRIFHLKEDSFEVKIKNNNVLSPLKKYFKKFIKENYSINEFYAEYFTETNEIFKLSLKLEREANGNLPNDEKQKIKETTGENMNYDKFGLDVEKIK